MSAPAQRWVVDASVGIKLFINDPLSAAAHRLFRLLTTETLARIYVPDLFYIEIANALWKYVRWQGLAVEEAQKHLYQLRRFRVRSVPTAALAADALRQADRFSISAYDASYVALAQRLSVPVITTDTKLANAVTEPHRVQLLTARA